jgi:hypothetical protein
VVEYPKGLSVEKKEMTTIRVSRRLVFAARTIATAEGVNTEGKPTTIEDVLWRGLWKAFPDKMPLVEQLAPVEEENGKGDVPHLDIRE